MFKQNPRTPWLCPQRSIFGLAFRFQKGLWGCLQSKDLDAIYGSVQNVFEVSLTPPPGGFFPGRLGVQVTTETDAFPSYCL